MEDNINVENLLLGNETTFDSVEVLENKTLMSDRRSDPKAAKIIISVPRTLLDLLSHGEYK